MSSTAQENARCSRFVLAMSVFLRYTGANAEYDSEERHSDMSDTKKAEYKKRMQSMYGINKPVLEPDDTCVQCKSGSYLGLKDGSIVSYKGIPFALPPVGSLRWKAPVAYPAESTLREAYYFGCSPIQTEIASELGSLYPQSEDCLYLNVWVNRANESTKKPVMFFIHGGSYGWGACSDPLYDAANLLREFDDIIVVSAEYRTGLLGFLDLSGVSGGEAFPDSANLGLLDQIEALRWVQNNIEAFGGDPDNVTIFGESAGGGSVSLLSIMPLAKGLFRRAIAESGSIALTYSREECAALTKKLLTLSQCKTAQELAALPIDVFRKLNEKLNDFNNFPMRDGRIVPEGPYGVYKSGASREVDLMIGTNADECRYWINELGGFSIYAGSIPVMVQNYLMQMNLRERYLAEKFLDSVHAEPVWKQTELLNELLFRVPALTQAALHADAGGKSYVYYWAYPSTLAHMGACHAVELSYVFNNLGETIYAGENMNRELARLVQQMWVSFARDGNPRSDQLEWPLYDSKKRMTMVFDEHSRAETDWLGKQRIMIEPMLHHYFNGCYTNLDYNIPYVRTAVTALALGAGALLTGLGALAYSIFHKRK